MTADSGSEHAGIAIIAMVGRFPGAPTLERFWSNLRNGVDSIERRAPPGGAEPGFVKAAGTLEDIECFDHQFFDYTPADAELIDPQQRLFLEQAHAALETAGYDPDRFPGAIGVFAGISTNRYVFNNIYRATRDLDSTRQFHIMVANDKDYLSTRVSYKLNLRGPSYSVQTACSTSLVAIHIACQSLLTGECDMALAGGVTVRVPQLEGYQYEEGMVYSKDGRVRSFDAAASGTVIGDGVGIVVLKPLDAALADRDAILAVIKGSATNNDGSFKASYAAPSKDGQARVILEAQALAGVNPESITYVEAHATGTLLGDPVEVAALTQAFRKRTNRSGFCAIGSVKSNVGHLDSAAGVAGLIKTVLMLQHRELVPTVHFAAPNPNIDFQSSPFYVSDRRAPWEPQRLPRRAAVSSFGVGGTNSHLIVDEAPRPPVSEVSPRAQVLPLSAKTAGALERMTENVSAHLREHPELNLADVAYTLAVGRRAFRYRRATVLKPSNADTNAQSSEFVVSGEVTAAEPRVVLLIPRLMPAENCLARARLLATQQPLYGEALQDCGSALGQSPDLASSGNSKEELRRAFVALYAFGMLWKTLGAGPQVIVGHGLGACVAAALSGKRNAQEALSWIESLSAGEASAQDAVAADVPASGQEGTAVVLTWEDAGATAPGDWLARDLARLWTAGAAIDWQRYYSLEARARMALPTYPFARHRHWIEPAAAGPARAPPQLHPLLHRNESSFERQCYTAHYSGQEFFLRDHVVGGQKTLPGVAYLEMARAAIAMACGGSLAEFTGVVLRNVVWMSPIRSAGAMPEVILALHRSAPETLEFTVNTRTAGVADEEPHSQGLALLRAVQRPESLDIAAVRARMKQATLEPDALYSEFSRQGLDYGSTHRAVRRIHIGPGQALAELFLPAEVAADASRYLLHPSVLDAALQAAAALGFADSSRRAPAEPALPFELGELEIQGSCVDAVYAYVRASESEADFDGHARRFDIDLCDVRGAIRARLKRFSTRSRSRVVTLADYRDDELKRYIRTWNALPASHFSGELEGGGAQRRVLAIGASREQREQLERACSAVRFISIKADDTVERIAEQLAERDFDLALWIAPEPVAQAVHDAALLAEQRAGVLALFRLIKALLALKMDSRDLALTVVTRNACAALPEDRVEPAHAGVHGLAGSLAQEYEHWQVRLLDLDSSTPWPVAAMLRTSPLDPASLAYRQGEWFSQQLVRAHSLPRGAADFKTGGVYVVLGGAGGIGEALSRHLAEQYQARMIWIGRRALDAAIQRKIDSFPESAPRPAYFSADATDRESLSRARARIRQAFPEIHGVVHSTIVLADKSLATMEEPELLASLAAKVEVSVRMAQVFADDALDFVLFFSSIQSFSRSAGQANYAAGCVFLDAFARRFAQERPGVVKTMSWGYWGGQGVVDTPEYRQRMAKAGIGSIDSKEGMAALTDLMRSSVPELVLYKGARTDVLRVASSDTSFSAFHAEAPSVINALRR